MYVNIIHFLTTLLSRYQSTRQSQSLIIIINFPRTLILLDYYIIKVLDTCPQVTIPNFQLIIPNFQPNITL